MKNLGAIDTMLGKVADWYEQEVDDAVEGINKPARTRHHGLSWVSSLVRYCHWYVSYLSLKWAQAVK